MADPKIKYDIEANVNGSTSVEDLESHLRQLGGVLEGDLAPQAIAAADALKSLGEKQAAVETLRTLSNESSAVALEVQQAQYQVDLLGTQMAEAATRAQAFARAELQAKAAVEGKSADLERSRSALLPSTAALACSSARAKAWARVAASAICVPSRST